MSSSPFKLFDYPISADSQIEKLLTSVDSLLRDDRSVSPSPPPSFYRDNNSNATSGIPNRPFSASKSFAAIELEDRSPGAAGSTLSQISGSVHASALLRMSKTSTELNRLIVLERKQKATEADFQLLLDVQSCELMQSYEDDKLSKVVDPKSESDSDNTVFSYPGSGSSRRKRSKIIPVRQPRFAGIGLSEARKGILDNIKELIEIKSEEIDILTQDISKKEEVLSKVDAWEKKTEGVKKQLQLVSSNEDVMLTHIQNDERAIESEIIELEKKLARLKRRRQALNRHIQKYSNIHEAKLSSYHGALREIDSNIKDFFTGIRFSDLIIRHEVPDFSSLSPSMNLVVAKKWCGEEISQVKFLIQDASVKKNALEEGLKIWDANMRMIMNFENNLRNQIMTGQLNDASMLQDQPARFVEILDALEHSRAHAEKQGWKLLICALGAEIEAIRKAQTILHEDLLVSERGSWSATDEQLITQGAVREGIVNEEAGLSEEATAHGISTQGMANEGVDLSFGLALGADNGPN